MKLDETQKAKIRKLHKQGISQAVLSERFGVSDATISLIVKQEPVA